MCTPYPDKMMQNPIRPFFFFVMPVGNGFWIWPHKRRINGSDRELERFISTNWQRQISDFSPMQVLFFGGGRPGRGPLQKIYQTFSPLNEGFNTHISQMYSKQFPFHFRRFKNVHTNTMIHSTKQSPLKKKNHRYVRNIEL